MQRRLSSLETNVEIRPLNGEKAVQAASDFIGEAFMSGVGTAVIIFEVQRSSRAESRKEEARKQELEVVLETCSSSCSLLLSTFFLV
ncbi:uncharacterized protein [Physcomitrium patens]|uniref:uncharacterized protein n=1 Tax=Physcomitrium patens TaxID=3218 RepID=UPI000D1616B5|nr:uncharacterized protein LOC112288969 [Physcomitrium patens]|eukprot:XP_024389544.1 uncharacterized protein LOC112288969 [Physcomitrella patens]